MGTYKRGDTWYIDYYFNGKRMRIAVGNNKKFAERVLAKRISEVVEGKHYETALRRGMKLEELVETYMDYARTNKTTWKRDDLSLRTMIKHFGNCRIEAISALKIEEYKSARLKSVKPATVNRELACLKHMLNKAIQWRMVVQNPVRSVKMLKENNCRIRYLSRQDVEKLVVCLPRIVRPAVLLALHTGMRKGELLALTWSDIDLENRLIFVRNSKNGEKREIPMNATIVEVLADLPKDTQHVIEFGSKNGRVSELRRQFRKALSMAAISDFRFHDLRHTFASHLAMAGVDLLTLKELLGHKTLKMTSRYAHLNPDHKRKAVERLCTRREED